MGNWTHDTPVGKRDGDTVATLDKIDIVGRSSTELKTALSHLWRSTRPKSRRDS